MRYVVWSVVVIVAIVGLSLFYRAAATPPPAAAVPVTDPKPRLPDWWYVRAGLGLVDARCDTMTGHLIYTGAGGMAVVEGGCR